MRCMVAVVVWRISLLVKLSDGDWGRGREVGATHEVVVVVRVEVGRVFLVVWRFAVI